MAHSPVLHRSLPELPLQLPATGSLDGDPRWQLAQRVVASRHFVRSAFLTRFLLYIVAETLLDRAGNITEHEIGVRVFDRPPSYRTVEDNIVRNYARQLRRRLTDFFADEGIAEPLHIDIPLGGYVPVFAAPASATSEHPRALPISIRPQSSADLPPDPVPVPAPAPRDRRRRRLSLGVLFALYTAALIGLTWFAAARPHRSHAWVEDHDPAAPLWASLFGGNINTYMVPSDAGFNLIEDLSHRPLSLADYIDGGYARLTLPSIDEHSAGDLRGQHFTSFVDLQIVAALERLPQFNPERAALRFPRDLRLDDIRNANAIILGSVGSNPWAAVAEGNANFRIVTDDGMQGATIVNAHPEPGEAATYVSHWNEPDHETFALVSCFPNLSGNGRLLVLQGLDVAGTQAAAEALLHPTAIAPILKRATRADDTVRSFEILLRTTSINSASTRTTVVASRVE